MTEADRVKVVPLEHVEDVKEDGKDVEIAGVRSIALAQALAEEQPRPFRRSFLKLYLCLAVAYMCSSTNGFDANTFGQSPNAVAKSLTADRI